MGYYSDYYLTLTDMKTREELEDDDVRVDEVYAALEEDPEYAECQCFDGDSTRWDPVPLVTEVSTRFPGLLFTIDREGEENEDMERIYVHAGVSERHKAVITFPDFQFPDDEGGD